MSSDHIPRRPPYIPGMPEELDSVIAAPENHTVVFENDRVCVLHVVIPPRVIEEKHTHKNLSVFIINASPNMDYFNDKGEIVARSGKRKDGEPFWVDSEKEFTGSKTAIPSPSTPFGSR